MEKNRYMISDAANMVQVEAHVLRYWEDELGIAVPRNELGHRYYTTDNIHKFQQIKDLKEQGYQLKTIKSMIHGDERGQEEQRKAVFLLEPESHKDIGIGKKDRLEDSQDVQMNRYRRFVEKPVNSAVQETDPAERMEKFKALMSDIVGQAISRNNEELSLQISRDVGEQILKEMDFLVREQDDASRERYVKLDEALRAAAGKRRLFSGQEKALRREEKKKLREERRLDKKIKKIQKKNDR